MEEQKTKARAAWKGSGDKKTDQLWFKIYEKVGRQYKQSGLNNTVTGQVAVGRVLVFSVSVRNNDFIFHIPVDAPLRFGFIRSPRSETTFKFFK